MPRYFFELSDGNRETDDVGVELGGIDDARREAVIFLGATIRDEPGIIGDHQKLRVDVRDKTKRLVLSVVAQFVDGDGLAQGLER